jgi:lysophospholipid acyltransferase (LPLAT)-like uncharacterized protein
MSLDGAAVRRLRFFLLERALLPAGLPALRALLHSWRLEVVGGAGLPAYSADRPLVVATCHGMFFHLLAFKHQPPFRNRRWVVLLSPSHDGRLLAAFLARFDIAHAMGTTAAQGVRGAHAFARRVAAGEVGVIAVDGPRGPCCQVSPGFLRVAAAAGADIQLALTAAQRGLSFGSWDRAHLPAPFARVQLWTEALSPRSSPAQAQTRLLQIARALGSPVLPPGLRERGRRGESDRSPSENG